MSNRRNLHRRLTRKALADVDAGLVIDHQTVQAWADKLSADELLADPNHSGQHMKEEQEWLDAPAVGLEVLTPYDPAEYLTSDEDIAIFLAEAEETGDAGYLARAQEVAERARAMNRTRTPDR